jgi:hypothetical protein
MQRLPNTPEGETKPIGFRLPPPMLALIDREVDTLRAASPEGASVTRSTALRALLVELEQRRAADPARAPTGDGREGERIAAAAAEVRRILAEMDTAGAELRALLEGTQGAVDEAHAHGERAPRGGLQRGRQERRADAPGGGAADRQSALLLQVGHTAADGQLSLLTRTANDGAAEATAPPQAAESRRSHAARLPASESTAPASAEVLAALKPRLVAALAAGHSAKALGRAAGVESTSITRWLSGARPGVSVVTARKLGEHLASRGL